MTAKFILSGYAAICKMIFISKMAAERCFRVVAVNYIRAKH